MTTIAYRNGQLAVDSQATVGNVRMPEDAIKVFLVDDGTAVAFAGSYAEGHAMLDWITEGRNPHTRPVMEETTVIEVEPGGAVRMHEGAGIMPFNGEYCAWGSGYQFALAALAMGKSAAEAVRFASQFDVFTGGTVRVADVEAGLIMVSV